MTLEDQFVAAFLPEPVRLLGQQLEPYSLGHELLLRRDRNLFLVGLAEKASNPILERALWHSHLFSAVFICCQRYEECIAALARPDVTAQIRAWQRRLGTFDLAAKIKEFQTYLRAGHAFPRFRALQRGGGASVPASRQAPPLGTPTLLRLYNHLRRERGYGEEQAWDTPLARAGWLFLSHCEERGHVQIKNQDELDIDQLALAEMKKRGLTPSLGLRQSSGAFPPNPS